MKYNKVLELLKDYKQVNNNTFRNHNHYFTIIKNSDSDKVISIIYRLIKDDRDVIVDYDQGVRIINLKELKLYVR